MTVRYKCSDLQIGMPGNGLGTPPHAEHETNVRIGRPLGRWETKGDT